MVKTIKQFQQKSNITSPPLQVGIYLRVSTEKQDSNYSKNIQLTSAQNYIDKILKNYEISTIIYDDTMSASLPPRKNKLIEDFPIEYDYEILLYRPELKRLLNDAKKHKLDILLVYCHDRLSREISEDFIIEASLNKFGVKVCYTKETEQFSENNPILNTIFSWLSVQEALTLSSRAFTGGKTATINGTWTGGKPPFGYKLENIPNSKRKMSKLRIIKSEADVVKEIFNLYIDGYTPKQIASKVESKIGKSISNHNWSRNLILDIIKNPTYTGYQSWNKRGGKKNPRRHESNAIIQSFYIKDICIIPLYIWNKANGIIKERSISSKDDSSHFLFKDIAKCMHCGNMLITKNFGSKNGSYYSCKNPSCLMKPSIRKEFFHENVFSSFKDSFESFLKENNGIESLYDSFVKYSLSNQAKINEKATLIENNILTIKNKLSMLDLRISQIENQISLGKISNDIKRQKQFLITSLKECKSVLDKELTTFNNELIRLNISKYIDIKDINSFESSIKLFFDKLTNILNKSNAKDNTTLNLNRSLRRLFKDSLDCIEVSKDKLISISFK